MRLSTVRRLKVKCESDGCMQYAEFYDPMGNKLCSDCIQVEVETGEYLWDECEAIEEDTSQQKDTADGSIAGDEETFNNGAGW